jgi:hypothetical protein
MTELSDILQHMARGGYRLHKQWGLMEPEAAPATPEPIKAPDGQAEGFDGKADNPMPLGRKDE